MALSIETRRPRLGRGLGRHQQRGSPWDSGCAFLKRVAVDFQWFSGPLHTSGARVWSGTSAPV